MFIADLFESYVAEAGPQLVVLYPGRFQPFHLGHGDVFRSLQSKFGRDSVYIATSNKVEPPKSPFNFSDKTVLMHAAGVPSDRIIEVKDPYKLPPQFNPANTIFIVAVGAPDAERLDVDKTYTEFTPTGRKSKIPPGKKVGDPKPFKSFTKLEDCVTADQHGYVIVANERQKVITLNGQPVDVSHGTQSRAAWNAIRNDPKGRSEFLMQMYGRDDAELGRVLDKIPQTVAEDAAGVGVVKNGNDPRYSMATMGDDNDVTAATLPKMMAGFHLNKRYKKLKEEMDTLREKWSAKYKRSINCNSPQGFSQRAHCQGRKK
jgi:cytidyltransferase-like protein